MVKKGIRLKDLHETIGAASNVRKATVALVLNEAFREIRGALERGDRVVVPDFGTFLVRKSEENAGRAIRFRPGDWADPNMEPAGRPSQKAKQPD